ncbi:MmcB family DNA repair protein [Croceicoccus sp. F390]|uniref:MmcB family DNA repair protein n=1 Tax=Croceicoccus esteveae TaxID=3075597 RepID=A0ABU2ZG89_9SPHN|nr:MmcB family DNA repair protein [Croceicoccus sp. F390]MDT0575415.1 MmcB family DNA repair protein [Croceicoccus sp. F390]
MPETDHSAGLLPRRVQDASSVARGICRLFARNGIWCLSEVPLRNRRRADIMGLDDKGRLVIVEIKVARSDLLGDGKWTDYLDYCDRFYWGLCASLDRSCMEEVTFKPQLCGLIVADGYDAEILRPAPALKLAAARRNKEVARLAQLAMRRRQLEQDPECAQWAISACE